MDITTPFVNLNKSGYKLSLLGMNSLLFCNHQFPYAKVDTNNGLCIFNTNATRLHSKKTLFKNDFKYLDDYFYFIFYKLITIKCEVALSIITTVILCTDK